MIFLSDWTIQTNQVDGLENSSYFSPPCFPVIDMIGSSRPISEKKLPCKKSSQLLSPSGEMPLMMNANSKILPSQDSNLEYVNFFLPSNFSTTGEVFKYFQRQKEKKKVNDH